MAEALPLQPGDPRRLGEYEITGRLGVGEHGAVFVGRDPAGRIVAVKLLHLRLSGEPAARARFAGAFAAARRVSGFCAAGILDADVEGDRPYVVSEFVDGPSLLRLVAEEGPRGAAVTERLAVGTAVALAAIHRAGAVHHDFKPANVLLGRGGPRVSDFAVAPALDAVCAAPNGRVTDDPSYKAPEQLSGIDIGPAADVFAWAATLLYAVTGRPPFGDDAPSEVMQRIVYDDPDTSALPESLREIVAGALAKDPSSRPSPAVLLGRLLDEPGPLAARIPESLAAEGRALARGSVPPPASAPASPPAPAAPAVPVPAPVPDPAPGPPSGERGSAPAEAWFGTRPVRPDSWSPLEPPTDLTRVDTPRIDVPGPGAASEDMATQNLPLPPSVPRPLEPADRTEPTPHLIPGMDGPDDDDHGGTAVLSLPAEEPERRLPGFLTGLPRLRPGNHLLGVGLSVAIGIMAGIAIITLVLLPQWGEDDGSQQAGPANAADDRPVAAVPEGFAGRWKGTAVNTARGASFPVEVTFRAGERTARAVYPQSHCTGTLTLTDGTNRRLRMSLTIPKPCTAGDVQVSRQPDGTLQYAWSTPGNRQLGYQGKLSRV